MRSNNRRAEPGNGITGETALMLLLVLGLLGGLGSVWVGMTLGHRWADTGATLPDNPFEMAFGLLDGTLHWPGWQGWVALGLVGLALLLLLSFFAWIILGGKKHRTHVDQKATFMGRGRDIASVSEKSARATAARLGVKDSPGILIGRTVSTGQPIYGSWEDMHVDIWGPRTGKTTSRAIPAILDAPGAVLSTSNKRDLVDATRGPRSERGVVWVFDPQRIADESADGWWWNPLSYVTDEVKASKLAGHFASGSREPGARTDAFFDPAGQDLLAGLLLAAALDERPISQVYRWLTRPRDEEPVEILRKHGQDVIADQVSGVIDSPEKQRGGVYGTAQQMASCLTNSQIMDWVQPRSMGDGRKQFDPAEFVNGTDTLFLLSREGKGTAGPLVTALTVAVVEAAEERATRSPGGRLPVPLIGVLDEAANVCRWAELPGLYSHYGSRGIVLMTILQSWSQGVDVWGESGMRKLWSASNVKVYGGGVAEVGFLDDLNRMIGSYDRLSASSTVGKGHASTSRQLQRERILDVDELAALPKGRAIVLASGARPTMVRTLPWMNGKHAEAVQASIKAHDPMAGATLTEAGREMGMVTHEEKRRARG